MQLKYVTSSSFNKPLELEVYKDKTIFIRKDVTTSTTDDGVIVYTYQEAKMSVKDYQKYKDLLMLHEQTQTTNDQLLIMDVLAQLYETILLGGGSI